MIAETDVLVVGGGSAGIAAAIGAAREGASVMLIERYGSLGGMATGGLIALLLSMDDGRGKQAVGGVCQDLVDRLDSRGAATYPTREQWGSTDEEAVARWQRWGLVWGKAPQPVRYNVAFDPEEMRFAANEILCEAGVRLRFHTWSGPGPPSWSSCRRAV